ncbi:hypothetical protein OJ998_34835 [Solirubrobacter taibaiensis]|nr:hypothetical protein [Solirubrobacter taibaiensis]
MTFTGRAHGTAMLRASMRRFTLLVLLFVAGCGSDAPEPAPSPTPRGFQGAQVQAPPPGSSGALVQIADSVESRTRLAFVDETRLAAAELPFNAETVRDRVLANGFQTSSESGIVSIGVGADEPTPAQDADANALAGRAVSAVQVCLGDPFAQTILGPETLGEGVAIGAGLAISPEDPTLVQLRVCGVPLVRELHAFERTMERLIGSRGTVEEQEIRELDLVAGYVAADALKPSRVLALLSDPSSL